MLTLAIPDERRWLVTTVPTMGTYGEIQIDGPAYLMASATRRLDELEASWSRFRPDSELELLHARAGSWTTVSPDLARILALALVMYRHTGGWFDPSVRTALEQLGYDRPFRSLDTEHDTPRYPPPLPAIGLDGLEVDLPAGRARVATGLRIDLGGIGKGLAADIVAHEAVMFGARAACVGLGGDVAVAGEPPSPGGWEIPVTHPTTGEELDRHLLTAGGMAMSTTLLRAWRQGTKRQHHLIDPSRGCPAETGIDAVAVVARSTARAEVLAKAALIAGDVWGRQLLREAGVKAWIVRGSDVERIEGDDF